MMNSNASQGSSTRSRECKALALIVVFLSPFLTVTLVSVYGLSSGFPWHCNHATRISASTPSCAIQNSTGKPIP